VDSVWEQEKLEARKMPENAAREASHTSGVRALLGVFDFNITPIINLEHNCSANFGM
jgi:hypothetical protein